MKKAIFLTQELLPRDQHLLELLSETHELEILILPDPESSESSYTLTQEQLSRLGQITVLGTSPFFRSLFREPSVEEALRERARQRPSDSEASLLWISRLGLAAYIPIAKALGFRVVLDHHTGDGALPFSEALSSPRNFYRLLTAAQINLRESRSCTHSDAVIVRSDLDAARLGKLAPDAAIHVLPNPVEAQRFTRLRECKGKYAFLFGDYRDPAQKEGIFWFISEVMPLLRAHYHGTTPAILVADEAPARESESNLSFLKAYPEIEVRTGTNDFQSLLSEAAFYLIPTRRPSDGKWRVRTHLQTRILQAMAAGRPVLSTGVGTDGLVLSPTFDIWIADAADRFAAALIHLDEDETLRKRISENAIRTVESRYDTQQARLQLGTILSSLTRRIR